MENPANTIDILFEKIELYSKTTIELSKYKLLNTSSNVLSLLAAKIVVVTTGFIFILVLNIGIALYLGELLGKNYYGFFIVAVFYLIATLVIYFFLFDHIKKHICNLIISQALH